MTSPTSANPVTTTFTPYSSAVSLFGPDPTWVSTTEDAQRVKAYDLYSRMYWNEPAWCKLLRRGDEDDQYKDIYLPSSRRIIEAINRYLAKDFNFVLDEKIGDKADQTIVQNYFSDFYEREKVRAKFGQNKRSGLFKGDALFHLTGDDSKDPGKRISIHRLDPASWFPIFDDESNTRVVGCHLVELVEDPKDEKKQIAKRQTYEIGDNKWVLSSLTYWEADAWDDRNLKPDQLKRVTGSGLPEWEDRELTGIPVIPVYHWKNVEWDDYAFGISELRGYESAIAAVNQSITDEDLTLIMQGLGVFWTNAGPPEDESGNEARLTVGPGVILEVPDGNSIGRLSGVSSIAPMQEHMQFILNQLDSSKGISDIAAGKVDVNVAESGIALVLQLSPLLSGNAEKELEILGTSNQMHYDMGHYWLPVYEGVNAGTTTTVKTTVGDPIPVNRKARIDEIIALSAANLILPDMAVEMLTEIGYVFPNGAAEALLSAAAKKVAAETPVDPFAARSAADQAAANDPSSNAGAGG